MKLNQVKPPASMNQYPEDVIFALMDMQYQWGMKEGWNVANSDNPDKLWHELYTSKNEHMKVIGAWQKAGRPPSNHKTEPT